MLRLQFWTSKIPEIDFTENVSDKKILKFPHCGLCILVTMTELWNSDITSRNSNSAAILEIRLVYIDENVGSKQKTWKKLKTFAKHFNWVLSRIFLG